MPTGPGDDILDAIEAGTADDAVMGKFKINAAQLKAFKSLHYGLSNEEMAYDEIGSYYPELESYFKRPTPLLPEQKQAIEQPMPMEPTPEPDVFKLVQEKSRLTKELNASEDISKSAGNYMGASVLANDQETLNKRKGEIAAINEQLKGAGYDPEAVTQSLSDLPNIPGINAKEALQMQQENPQQFDRYKAAIKSQYGLLHAIEKREGAKAANAYLQQYQQMQKAPDYASQRTATKQAIEAVHKYVDNVPEQQKLIRDLIRDKSYGYGVGLPGQEEAINNDPRIQSMNPYQVAGMQFLEDVDPATAQSYNRLLAFTPEEVAEHEKDSSFARGYQLKARDLERIGMNLMQNSLEEKLNSMLKVKGEWKDEDRQKYAETYQRYQTLTDDFKGQSQRYPAVAILDADRLMQDAMGESTKGVAEKTVLGIGENVDDAVNWIGGLIRTPFQNNKESALDDMILLGDKKLSQLGQYETEGQELFNREFKTVFKGDLKKQIDGINEDPTLSKDEKRDAITSAIYKDSWDNVVMAPNDQAGKTNFTAKAVLNTVSNVASEIVPQIALAYISGGSANASKLKELSTLFGSTFATAYNDIYTEALEKNIPNPSQYALVHTTIEAGTELLFNDLDKVKKLFGGKLTGKILENVGEQEMKLLAKTGRFALLKEGLKDTGKEALKNSAQEAFEEISGQVAGNIADKKLFNQDIDTTDDVLKTGVTTFIGMLPLAGLGLPFRYKEISQMQKYAVYEAAMNPEKYLARVDQDLEAGTITPSEAEARKATITKASKLAKSMNAVQANGDVMSDNEKADLLTNEVVTDSVKEQKKGAPAETKEKLEQIEETLDKEKEKLLKPKKNASKPKAKAKTQAEVEGVNVAAEPKVEATAPVDEGAAKLTVEGEAAPAGATEADELQYTNPGGTEYVLRGDKLAMVGKDGKETVFSDEAMQTKSTKELVETIKKEGTPPLKINTVDDLDVALKNMGKKQQTLSKNTKPLPKYAAGQQTGAWAPVDSDKTVYTPQTIIQKARESFKDNPLVERVANFLEPIINANPNIRIDHDAEIPNNVYGFSHNDGRIELNFKNHANEGALIQTALHEMVHAATRAEIENNPAFRAELDEMLGKVREQMDLPDSDVGVNTALQLLSRMGKMDETKYGAANAHELIAELFTNQKFRDELAKIKYKGDSLLKQIFLKIAKFLSEAYSKLAGVKEEIKADDLADYLMQLTEKTVGGQQPTGDTAGELALMAPSQEDALRKIIKATPKSIADEVLKDRIVNATGADPTEVQELIDEIRKPLVATEQLTHTSGLTEQSRQVSLNKFKRLTAKQKSNEPGWWQRTWEGIRNGSAWIDNPYRFITKITEDINKEYGLSNTEAIPLGRQFEKSAGGRAALRVDSFINEVVRGKIGDQNLGRLKGQAYEDFQLYLSAKRVIDRLNKQEEKQLAGEDVSRGTGNITRQDAEVQLEDLENKYGSLDDFAARAKAMHKHMDNMLLNLVASGILSQESYDNIKKDNNFYAPFSVVQSKLYAMQDKQPVGISGVVKRIKGIDYQLPKTKGDALAMVSALGGALQENIITPEEYFNVALQVLDEVRQTGKITNVEYENYISDLENPGFAINDILDAAANMIYKSEGMALRNRMLQRLYAYKASDPKGLFIQDVEGFAPMTAPDGSTRMVAKPLSSIKVEPGMAPIKLKVDGKDVMIAVNKHAAEKLTTMSNAEVATVLKVSDAINKIFRATVITLSPGFQVVNFAIDFTRTAMLSRYGPIAGKGLVQPIVNAALFMPQYIEALFHSALGNVGIETKTYKQWMESDSFSKGMFDNLFDNEKRIKEVNAPLAKRVLMNMLKLKFIDVPGSILEQTHKLATYQRGMSIEGFKPEMFTAMLASSINRNVNPNMSQQELNQGLDRLNYEVQNFAGSPNFPQTHKWMKATSLFLQFFSARVKGEITDYRRIANLFAGKAEGVQMSKQEVFNLGLQFGGSVFAIAMYAWMNNAGDDDEKEFNGLPSYHQDNYLNIPLGYFEWEDENGESHTLRDYAKMPLRGLTATMNVMANSFVRFYKRHNPEEFKKAGLAFAGNASPVNLNGKDARELGESLASNLTPIFKYFIEYSFNRDTHNHRDIVPDFVTGKGMLSKYRAGQIDPWDVATKKTPEWAKTWSKFIFDNTGFHVSAIELDHMENTMGNPTELYENAIRKRLFRSEMKYPLYVPKDIGAKNTSSATVTPVTQ